MTVLLTQYLIWENPTYCGCWTCNQGFTDAIHDFGKSYILWFLGHVFKVYWHNTWFGKILHIVVSVKLFKWELQILLVDKIKWILSVHTWRNKSHKHWGIFHLLTELLPFIIKGRELISSWILNFCQPQKAASGCPDTSNFFVAVFRQMLLTWPQNYLL